MDAKSKSDDGVIGLKVKDCPECGNEVWSEADDESKLFCIDMWCGWTSEGNIMLGPPGAVIPFPKPWQRRKP